MKKILPICISALVFLSCRKNNSDLSEMGGSWKLVEVYDKNTSTVSHKPAGSDLDVVITFLSSSSFAGHTLRNTFSEGTYSQSGNGITFGSFSMTKVGEDDWGGSFLTVLHACYLQSMMPCSPSTFQIQGNTMKISTSLRYDITLQRL
jgi:heat shock protein HslJ